MTAQRRAHVRVESQLSIRVQRLLDSGEPTGSLDTYALDVSGGGLRIAGPGILAIGDRVRFELELPDSGDCVQGVARVARVAYHAEHGATQGLEIERLADGEREAIVRHVFSRQRELLRQRAERSEAAR